MYYTLFWDYHNTLYKFSSLKGCGDIHLQTKDSGKFVDKLSGTPVRLSLMSLTHLTASWFYNIIQVNMFKKLVTHVRIEQ